LALKAQNGDVGALNKLWKLCEPYARKICSRFAPHSNEPNWITEYNDCVQSGYLAFRKALEKWVPKDNVRFKMYLSFWVSDYCRRELGISNSTRKEVLLTSTSLDCTLDSGDNDDTHLDFIEDESTTACFEEIEIRNLVEIVRREVAKLPIKQQDTIMRYYYDNLLLKEIAAIYDVSMTTSQRYLENAHRQLRKSRALQLLYREIRNSAIDERQTIGTRAFKIHHLSGPEAYVIIKETFREDMAKIFMKMG